MESIKKLKLRNGLTVLVQEDKTTPMVVVNILYKVGAKHENIHKTGFAHLFEHLMFSGSINIPEFDKALQKVGGENNAFTSNDYTNFYCSLPAVNIETAFWLESDRMLSLAFDINKFETQKKVVCEEFRENYLNKPYGDVWHLMRSLAYKEHPYQWMTIGKELSHIEEATINEAKEFFFTFYRPNNAILSVVGNVTLQEVERLANKWFGDIPSSENLQISYSKEPPQNESRIFEKKANVPFDYIMKTWHVEDRLNANFYTMDLITDVLGGGDSSRLYQSLVKEQTLFSSINCYHLGALDPSLFVIEGKLNSGVSIEKGNNGIQEEIEKLKTSLLTEPELNKISNRIETIHSFEDTQIMHRAHNIAYFELIEKLDVIDQELARYKEITNLQVQQYCQNTLVNNNSNTLFYYAK